MARLNLSLWKKILQFFGPRLRDCAKLLYSGHRCFDRKQAFDYNRVSQTQLYSQDGLHEEIMKQHFNQNF